MDLNSGKLITQNIIHDIPVTNIVIKAAGTAWPTVKTLRVLSLRRDMG